MGGVGCKFSSKLELMLQQPKSSYRPTKVTLALYMDLTISAFALGSEQWQPRIPELLKPCKIII